MSHAAAAVAADDDQRWWLRVASGATAPGLFR